MKVEEDYDIKRSKDKAEEILLRMREKIENASNLSAKNISSNQNDAMN